MLQRHILSAAVLMYLSIPVASQELLLSTARKSYNITDQVWVNLSITDAKKLPGAYSFDVNFPNDKLSYVSVLPAEKGPFTITPAASAKEGVVSVAGFQGITETGTGNVSLATLVFLPLNDRTTVDTATFSLSEFSVFSTQAETMEVTFAKRGASVLLPQARTKKHPTIRLTRNYLTFSVIKSGITTVRLFNLNGQVVVRPLFRKHCKSGTHGIPLPSGLRSGIYIGTVQGNGFTTTQRLEVVK